MKKKPAWMTEEQYEIFHGERPKVGVQHFFDEGCICAELAVDDNPFWERTKEIYYSKPHKLQKTIRMTAVYYKEMLKQYPAIAYRSLPKATSTTTTVAGALDSSDGSDTDFKPGPKLTRSGSKRKIETDTDRPSKRVKFEADVTDPVGEASEGGMSGKSKGKGKGKTTDGKTPESRETSKTVSSNGAICTSSCDSDVTDAVTSWPLLQLPTGSGKVYTLLDQSSKTVWKGPYRGEKLSMVTFFHHALEQGLGDPHTLPLTPQPPYATFPLAYKLGNDITVTTRDFYDAISRKQVTGGGFVLRETLGVVQLHNLAPAKIDSLPLSLWLHYAYRFCLNIGDSGLYNAITDTDMSFIYGIDMEEKRKNVKGNDIINLLFVKLPRKIICDKILICLRKNKTQLLSLIDEVTDEKIGKIISLSEKQEYDFQIDTFRSRMAMVEGAIKKL